MSAIDQKRFIEALNTVAASESGQVVLAVLAHECGWDKTFLSSEAPQTTQYYATKRGVYNGLRQHIKKQYLKKIEFDYTIKTQMENTNARQSRHIPRPATNT